MGCFGFACRFVWRPRPRWVDPLSGCFFWFGFVCGLLMGGESIHDNHHHYQTTRHFDNTRWTWRT